MIFYSGVVMIAAAFVGDKLGGYPGRRIGLAIGAFPTIASLVGELDQVWRLALLSSVRRRLRTNSGASYDHTLRLVAIAQRNTRTPLYQVAVGLAVALPLALIR
jgi:hypothetical protein